MHPNAKEWDKCHDSRGIPEHRPCDWCGKVVAYGYIHHACLEKERDLYQDIAHG